MPQTSPLTKHLSRKVQNTVWSKSWFLLAGFVPDRYVSSIDHGIMIITP